MIDNEERIEGRGLRGEGERVLGTHEDLRMNKGEGRPTPPDGPSNEAHVTESNSGDKARLQQG